MSGLNGLFASCPLYSQQQTFVSARGMSEKCQRQTCPRGLAPSSPRLTGGHKSMDRSCLASKGEMA